MIEMNLVENSLHFLANKDTWILHRTSSPLKNLSTMYDAVVLDIRLARVSLKIFL